MAADKKDKDIDLDLFDSEDSDFANLFGESDGILSLPEEKISEEKPAVKGKPAPPKEESAVNEPASVEEQEAEPAGKQPDQALKRKRNITDFEPDMDALLLTAQSSMIIEGMENYNNGEFGSEKLQIYIEALKGVDLYIKILNRNPGNYRKLKTLIDTDIDCQQVEKIAFELYQKEYETTPDTDREKLEAFELFKQIFRHSVNKANISKSMKIIKKYFLLSGGVDLEKLEECVKSGSLEIKRDITNFQQQLKLALEMLKKGDSEIAKGLRGRDLNVFITKTSELLGYYYKLNNNIKISDYFFRIYNIYKKYFIMK